VIQIPASYAVKKGNNKNNNNHNRTLLQIISTDRNFYARNDKSRSSKVKIFTQVKHSLYIYLQLTILAKLKHYRKQIYQLVSRSRSGCGYASPNWLHVRLSTFSYSLLSSADCCRANLRSSISSKKLYSIKTSFHHLQVT